MRSQVARVAIGSVIAVALLWGAWQISKGGAGDGMRNARDPGKPASVAAQPGQSGALRVDVSGVRGDHGYIIGTLCKEGEAFPSGCTRRARAKAADGVVSLDFKGLAQGDYAVALYHDENGNSQLELGTEGVGFSNNANLAKTAPQFDASRIKVNGATRIRVRIRYSI
ncbi:DUF2141 domain-containing protein [Lysobacter sp. cf310]|uniref:DUF2141 domain-containing protein n=1 Tax=Lysobacter sp. cf310 TaxID=1761790 RepID=UPI0008E4C0F0|nr:DUF2141 domain-containing protein [Lysobacter sp. cf310]SFK95155.1 Uncharacterized conserved protein, DUF2141 family [Lysobacter sp. cf310]